MLTGLDQGEQGLFRPRRYTIFWRRPSREESPRDQRGGALFF
jgi:hypothetical protein